MFELKITFDSFGVNEKKYISQSNAPLTGL